MSSQQIALIGNPNCGKSTIFNRLTGTRQKVGNWPGVTVAKKIGHFQFEDESIEVIDLPGIYSLTAYDEISEDVRITTHFLATGNIDCLVNVIDATHLERHLYLTAQLLEYQIPMIVVLNMQDVAQRRGIHIDCDRLAESLGCPVISTIAHLGEGMEDLCLALSKRALNHYRISSYPPVIGNALVKLQALAPQRRTCHLLHLLEGDINCRPTFDPDTLALAQQCRSDIATEIGEDADTLIVDARYQFIHHVCLEVVDRGQKNSMTNSARLDQVLLNRWLGLPIFFGIMYLTFIIAINFGNAFQDFFAISSQAIFVEGVSQWLTAWHAPHFIVSIMVGVGMGIHTTVTFIPILLMLFIMLSILESTGYMARAAFVMDRFMSFIGLPGKAFLPLIIGFGCNVPAIMASRTLDSERERITTILMSPFMSCSARLAVFSVFVAAFFPQHGASVIFSLYLVGIACALLTGYMIKLTLLAQESSPLVYELPAYHRPNCRNIVFAALERLKSFLWRAGKIIIPVCVVLSIVGPAVLAEFGKAITPIFQPMGITPDNWPATVGLLTGTLAKEVLIGSLNTMYSQIADSTAQTELQSVSLLLQQALWSIPQNLSSLWHAFFNPIAVLAPHQEFDRIAYGEFVHRFQSPAAAYSYLLFVLLYIPCVSTFAVTVRELNWQYAAMGLLWSIVVAYTVATTFFQMTLITVHPWQSLLWLLGSVFILLSLVAMLKLSQQKHLLEHVAP